MVRGIVAIARELGVLTVAEGIEDEATLEPGHATTASTTPRAISSAGPARWPEPS